MAAVLLGMTATGTAQGAMVALGMPKEPGVMVLGMVAEHPLPSQPASSRQQWGHIRQQAAPDSQGALWAKLQQI